MEKAEKSNMAVIFSQNEYLSGFMNYLYESNTGFSCYGFTNGGKLMNFAKENGIAVLLTDKESYEGGAKQIKSEVTVVLTDRTEMEEYKDAYVVDILQPVDEILREVLSIASMTDIRVSAVTSGNEGVVYTVYSPVKRCLKTTFAMTMAQILSEKEDTIYVNLEPDSGFSALFMESYEADLSDLVFYLRDGGRDRFGLRLQSIVRENRGVKYIPPVSDPGDLSQINADEMIELLSAIKEMGYRELVLDMGIYMGGFERILKASDRIYVPVRKDSMSQAKISQINSYLHFVGQAEQSERMQILELPYFKDIPGIAGDLRNTDLGRYVRELLEKDL